MSEIAKLLALWHDIKGRGEEYVLVTVVRVEGSSYRKPGARMLVTAAGKRVGTISGGCLEADVVRKAFWLTGGGPAIERYQSSLDEDGSAPFGLGCGGTITILLERGNSADEVLGAMERSVKEGTSFAIVTVVDANSHLLSRRLILAEEERGRLSDELKLMTLAKSSLAARRSSDHRLRLFGEETEVFAEYLPRPTSLVVFGAGDDAQPVVEAAAALGWQVSVVDGRAHLIREERFPLAHRLIVSELANPLHQLDSGRVDAAVVMTHSYEQDRAALASLLQTAIPYIGVLGPRHRTSQLLAEAASIAGQDPEVCSQRLHSPVGLDLGADTPAAIALSIVAEVFSVVKARAGTSMNLQMSHTPLEIPA